MLSRGFITQSPIASSIELYLRPRRGLEPEPFNQVVPPMQAAEISQVGDDGDRRKVGVGFGEVSELVPVSKDRLPDGEPTRAAAAAFLRRPGVAETGVAGVAGRAEAPPNPGPVVVVVDGEVVVAAVARRRRPGHPVAVRGVGVVEDYVQSGWRQQPQRIIDTTAPSSEVSEFGVVQLGVCIIEHYGFIIYGSVTTGKNI